MLKELFRRKSVAEVVPETETAGGLRRSLGALDLTMLGIGAIIGAGLFSSIADMVAGTMDGDVPRTLGAGPGVMVSYCLTALACGFAALCYAEIAAMVPVSGSAYSYSYVAFGEVVAWIIGWDLIVEYAIGNIYVAQKWGSYFQSFLNGMFGLTLPAWLTNDFQTGAHLAKDPALASSFPMIGDHVFSVNLPAGIIVLLLTALLFIGVKESARANAIMVGLKLLLIAAFIGIGFFHIDTNNWTPFAPNGFTGIWHGAALGFFSYIGFDAVSTAGEETRDPQRNLPRGMIWSLVICTVLYIATAAVLTGMLTTAEIKEHAGDPLAAAFRKVGMPGASTAFALGAVIAMTAVLLVFQLGQTRIFMVMARDGLLPKAFSKIHPRFRTPHISTWITGVFVACMCSVLTPDQAIGLTNIGTLFAFVLVSIGVIVLRVRYPDKHRPFKVPGYPLTPVLSALACLALIVGLERSNWLRFGIWLAIGLVVYLFYGRTRSVLANRTSPM